MREKPSHHTAFAAAVVGVLVAWGLRWLLASAVGDRLPFITFFPMLFALAWWGGFWPVYYATILSIVVLDLVILEPIGSIYIAQPEYRIGLAVFAAIGVATAWLGERVHWAKRGVQRA